MSREAGDGVWPCFYLQVGGGTALQIASGPGLLASGVDHGHTLTRAPLGLGFLLLITVTWDSDLTLSALQQCPWSPSPALRGSVVRFRVGAEEGRRH